MAPMSQLRPRRSSALLLALALVLAACGGDDDDTAAHDDGGHGDNAAVADDARVIEVTGDGFAFDPNEVEVAAGEPIAIALTAADIEHDFVIEELDLHVVAAKTGETETGGFMAPEAGTYTYYCSVEGHRDAGMEGTLTVK